MVQGFQRSRVPTENQTEIKGNPSRNQTVVRHGDRTPCAAMVFSRNGRSRKSNVRCGLATPPPIAISSVYARPPSVAGHHVAGRGRHSASDNSDHDDDTLPARPFSPSRPNHRRPLRTEVTQDDLMQALHHHCADWTEADRESVTTLAQGIAYRISDIAFESCAEEFPKRMAYAVHYIFVSEQLRVLRGQMQPHSPEDRRESMIDRHLLYPLRFYMPRPMNSEGD